MISLDELQIEKRPKLVYFATNDFIIYKDGPYLYHNSCDDENLNTFKLPIDHKHYQCLDMVDAVMLLFAGKSIAVIDKSGNLPINHDLDQRKIGRVITKLFPSNDYNSVVFGTKLFDRIQFVNYDFMDHKRISQTSSWNMTNITDITSYKNDLFAILDNAFVVCCGMDSGETKWTRFESGRVNPKILIHNDTAFYTCQNMLKSSLGASVESTRIPLVKIHSLQSIHNGKLYFTANKGASLCCYDLATKTLVWEIPGNLPIKETLVTQGKYKGRTYDIMLLRMENHLGIVNLSLGKTIHYRKILHISRIRETGNYILIHKHPNETEIIPGVL